MPIIDDLTADLDWRESELGSLKVILQKPDMTRTQQRVLLRAAWAMLYAHYEGFSKFCFTMFYSEASRRMACCHDLPATTRALALDRDLKRIRSLPSLELVEELRNISQLLDNERPNFPEVDTKSNLWPSVLQGLLLDADIELEALERNRQKIKTLVSRRNDIAHGQQSLINEIQYYFGFEDAVYDVMYELAYAVEARLSEAPYS